MSSLPSWERGLKSYESPGLSYRPLSLPSWERGLKYTKHLQDWGTEEVAPLVGAWIEIGFIIIRRNYNTVAPLVGAWIEIDVTKPQCAKMLVAPLVGAWIEIVLSPAFASLEIGRSPRGSVD